VRPAARTLAQRGLTLLEVMISMAIMVGLFIIVYATFNSTRRTYAKVTKIQDRWHVVRNGLARMTQDLSMAYVSLNENMSEVDRRTYFRFTKGDYGDELRFSSFAHRRLYKDANESDQCIIQYFLAPDPDDRSLTSLFRRETRRLANEEPEKIPGEAYVLIDDVLDIRYEFFDKTQDKWQEEWDTTTLDGQPNRLPHRIRIYLTIRSEIGNEVVLVTQAAPALTDGIVLTPGAAGGTSTRGSSSTTGRSANPFASSWSRLKSRSSSLGTSRTPRTRTGGSKR
jgi:general secretion pathway protein J